MNSLPPNINREVVANGSYGAWLHPFVEMENTNLEISAPQTANSEKIVVKPPQRARGRPRVPTARDASTVERRRAQVRNAQRAYQERKDDAMAKEKQKCNAVLQVLSDLSVGVEEFLQIASLAGNLEQDSEVGVAMRRMRDTLQEVTNRPCVELELKELRKAHNQRQELESNCMKAAETLDLVKEGAGIGPMPSITNVDLELIRIEESTLIGAYVRGDDQSNIMSGKNIFQVVSERQAALKNAENSLSFQDSS